MKTRAEEISFLIARGNLTAGSVSRLGWVHLLARQVVVFSAVPSIIALTTVTRFFSKKAVPPKLIFHSLTIGQVMPGGDYQDFIEFIQAKRFGFDCRLDEVLVELKDSRRSPKRKFAVTRNIPLYLLIKCLSWKEFLFFCKSLILTSWIILKNGRLEKKSFRVLIQIQIEYSLWQAVKQPDYFVTTQSSMQKLPVSFYMSCLNFQRLMMWYSTNNRPIVKVGDRLPPRVYSEELETFIDRHFVWNQEEATWLRSNGITKLEVVGSIIFRSPLLKPYPDKIYDILYFDVTAIPRNDIFMSEDMLLENLTKFAANVQQLRFETNSSVTAYIKPKREDQKLHSKKYLALRNRLVTSGVIQILDYESNLYETIARSRVVLATPFTSPANIALELGIPAAYFCFLVRDYQLGQQLGDIPILTQHHAFQVFLRNSLSL